MLRYCAWCGCFMGSKPGEGFQIVPDRSEIETTTICPSCRQNHLERSKRSRHGAEG